MYMSRAHVGLRADADGAVSSSRVDLGTVATTMASGALVAVAEGAWQRWVFDAGAGMRGGLVSFRGAPDAGAIGHTLTRGWAGPLATGSVGFSFSRAWMLMASGEAGWVTREAAGLVAGAPSVAIEKGWWSAALGLAFAP
jgi:hypothetical protein